MVVYKTYDFKIALFIDAENVSYNNAGRIIDILEKKGNILVREIVADWTKINVSKKDKKDDNLTGWRGVAATSSMTAIQQFTYRPNKNSSNIALAIRAMKTLYEKPYIDLFCIVSNDCDFTRLAQELREHNKDVIGMGEKEKSIEEFVKAFSEYIYLDEKLEDTEEDGAPSAEAPRKKVTAIPVKPETKKKTAKKVESIIGNERLSSLTEIIHELVDERGRALYSNINGLMKNKYPDFVPQNFGCKNFRQLMDALMPDLTAFEKVSTNDDFALVEKKK